MIVFILFSSNAADGPEVEGVYRSFAKADAECEKQRELEKTRVRSYGWQDRGYYVEAFEVIE